MDVITILALRMFLYTKVWFQRGMWKMFLVAAVTRPQTFSTYGSNEKFLSALGLWLTAAQNFEATNFDLEPQ